MAVSLKLSTCLLITVNTKETFSSITIGNVLLYRSPVREVEWDSEEQVELRIRNSNTDDSLKQEQNLIL